MNNPQKGGATIDELLQRIDKICDLSDTDSSKLFSLASDFNDRYHEEEHKLPCGFNLLNIIKPDENAHSRILAKLFRYQNTEGEYVFLKSFLKFLNVPASSLKIDRPEITVELYRIDIFIQEKEKYAVILENKIHNAIDQPQQLQRYIDTVKKLGYKEEGIHIICLPATDTQQPIDNSWGKYEDSIIREKHYYLASFDRIVLPWLQGILSEEIDITLTVDLRYYAQYLEEILNPNKKTKVMSDQLLSSLKEKCTSLESVEKTLQELLRLEEYLSWLKSSLLLKKWEEYLKQEDDQNSYRVKHMTLFCEPKDKEFRICIEIEDIDKGFYLGIKAQKDSIARTQIAELLKDRENVELPESNNKEWYYWAYSHEKVILKEYKNLINAVLNRPGIKDSMESDL